jgi:23S rRNA pseudouridine2604 synthase
MARITLKITKPVDANAPAKPMTSRARRAMPHNVPKPAPVAVPRAVPSAAPATPRPATSPVPGRRRRQSTDANARHADPQAARGPRAESRASHARRGEAGATQARRQEPNATDARRTESKSADTRADPRATDSRRRTSTSKTPYGAKPHSANARHAPSSRDKPASNRPASAPKPRNSPTPAAKGPPRHENPGDPRLSKRMSELGLCSRREADEWIENGWVKVDGNVVTTLGVRVSPHARIDIDPAASQHQSELVTILLNKPIGYVSGLPEHGYEPAMVLIKPENRWPADPSPTRFKPSHLRGLAPAGRLDIDSTGLIVFTQDGRIAKHLIGRDSAVEKEYLVRVEGTLSNESMKLLQHGLELDGIQLRPARVSWQNEDQLRFVLREGRKRQIRRMCELVGLVVTGLKRVRSGGVPLGPLPLGQWRYLRRDEKF